MVVLWLSVCPRNKKNGAQWLRDGEYRSINIVMGQAIDVTGSLGFTL